MAACGEVYGEEALEVKSPAAVLDPPSLKNANPIPSDKPTEKPGSSNSEISDQESDAPDCVRESALKSNADSESERQMKGFVDFLKKMKLNPQAKEFVPSYYYYSPMGTYYFLTPDQNLRNEASSNDLKKRNNNNPGKKRASRRASKAQTEDRIKRTVYISDIDHNITEERLADLFSKCGHIVDCRVCGDPRSRLRFAFVEFAEDFSAKASLSLSGMMLESSSIKVMPSKTAILPVNPTFLPRSEDEREMCARTVYCTNIDRKATEEDVRTFFERKCGEAECATSALDCCGEMLGNRRIRISPSKTPVRSLTSSASA
ncbi:polyadenylate-binding protein-interacting protein 8-like isoform X2 [Andrographis paniculata]|uniref:polyadenylate-binding protein-interacting protein 8-like isoform X2 n=1 Tax=Andrographis paniculata TaxID=175694 RepID=UPI0021E789AE|nr:polyadenylate-binding protein-interacting protein 8-like isoform X2 [Andrographis paniculata]